MRTAGIQGGRADGTNLLNQGASKVNYVASDRRYGGQVTRSANITITAKTSRRSIAENSTRRDTSANVGRRPVTGTPYNGVANDGLTR